MLLLGARGWQKQNCGRPAGSCSVVRKTDCFVFEGIKVVIVVDVSLVVRVVTSG